MCTPSETPVPGSLAQLNTRACASTLLKPRTTSLALPITHRGAIDGRVEGCVIHPARQRHTACGAVVGRQQQAVQLAAGQREEGQRGRRVLWVEGTGKGRVREDARPLRRRDCCRNCSCRQAATRNPLLISLLSPPARASRAGCQRCLLPGQGGSSRCVPAPSACCCWWC